MEYRRIALAPNMDALTIFQAKASPELTACQISRDTMATPRCDPTTWMTVLAISSPVDWKRCLYALIWPQERPASQEWPTQVQGRASQGPPEPEPQALREPRASQELLA